MTSADLGTPDGSSAGVIVGGADHAALMWMAQDDANPRRRSVFGTEDAARRFAAGMQGWSAFADQDDRWRPITGQAAATEPHGGLRQH